MMKPTMLSAITMVATVVELSTHIYALNVLAILMPRVLLDILLLQSEMATAMMTPILKNACLMDSIVVDMIIMEMVIIMMITTITTIVFMLTPLYAQNVFVMVGSFNIPLFD